MARADDPAPLPLQLAPGVRVVPRGSTHLQVGLHPARRVVLRRVPAVEDALARMSALEAVDASVPEVRRALHRLAEHGLLDDRTDLAARARLRDRARVSVRGRLPGTDAGEALATAGLRTTAAHDADVVLVLAVGEVAREDLDPLVRAETDHLVVRLVDGGAVLGPFVVPGTTACLRCIDAHQLVADPGHVVVTTRYRHATLAPRTDGVPDVADPLLPRLALDWAVRDVLAHVEGREPATWSRTLHLGPDPADRHDEEWWRHPHCGCSWAADSRPSGTMGA